MRHRKFLIQQIIILLILSRTYSHFISFNTYALALLILMVIKYFAEGFTPFNIFFVAAIIVQMISQIYVKPTLMALAALSTILIPILSPRIFWLPDNHIFVGFRQKKLQNELMYGQFYPLKQMQISSLRKMEWNHDKGIDQIAKLKGYESRLEVLIFKFWISYIKKQKIIFGIGHEEVSNKSVAFCHGRAVTPFMYSQLLLPFAQKGYRVGFVIHHQVFNTKLGNKQTIKKFRQKQVRQRAAEYCDSIKSVESKEIILMGHSYGGSTVIVAYHKLDEKLKKKIKQIILLDPWLFPLDEYSMKKQFQCPVLVLWNRQNLLFEDRYHRYKQFLKAHPQINSVLWKNGVHLHQTDLGLILGKYLNMVENSHLSLTMIKLNLQAMDKFLKGQAVEGQFGDREVDKNYSADKLVDRPFIY